MAEEHKLKGLEAKILDGSKLKIGIVRAKWNVSIIDGLIDGLQQAFDQCKVPRSNVKTIEVAGAFELPMGARRLIEASKGQDGQPTLDAVVCVGCLIKGETMHFEYIADAASHGIMRVGLDTGVPVIFGVLTVLTEQQAVRRSQGEDNQGTHWGLTAVEMGLLKPEKLKKDLGL